MTEEEEGYAATSNRIHYCFDDNEFYFDSYFKVIEEIKLVRYILDTKTICATAQRLYLAGNSCSATCIIHNQGSHRCLSGYSSLYRDVERVPINGTFVGN